MRKTLRNLTLNNKNCHRLYAVELKRKAYLASQVSSYISMFPHLPREERRRYGAVTHVRIPISHEFNDNALRCPY